MFDPTTAAWVALIVAVGVFTVIVWIGASATRSMRRRRLLGRTIGVTIGALLAFVALVHVYFSTGGIILGM